MAEERTPEPEEVDLDLDFEDAALREAIGKPTRIRINKHTVTFPHHKEWTTEQTREMSLGMFDVWAEELLSPEDFKVWQAAELKNYQLEAITKKMLDNMQAESPGKSRPSLTSRPRRRRN